MIATPNPRYGQLTGGANNERDENPNIFVFRPWSQTDRQNVLKDVPSLNEGFIQWREAVELIRRQWFSEGGVFTVDPETGFVAFASGYRGQRQGQRRNRGRKRAGFRGDRRDKNDRDNRCYNCGKEGHFARDCRNGSEDQSK